MKEKPNIFKMTELKIATTAFLIIALFFGVLFTTRVKTVDKKAYELSPEDKRAMNYNLKTDEDAKIEGTDYVLFDAYFLRDLDKDGYAEKYDGTCRSIDEKAMLYMDVNVLTEGKLINGVIKINGQNFDLGMSMIADDVLKNNYLSDNVKGIALKDVNAGTQKLIFGKITPRIDNNINNYGSNSHSENSENNIVNSITFSGTYVPLEGDPVEINKTIYLDVDWYGYTTARMIKNTKYEVLADDIEDGEIKFNFEINETSRQLILKENQNIVKIPELCGFAPLDVQCTTRGVTSSYNEETKELTISRESNILENGRVYSTISREKTFEVSVKYPEEAYRAIGSYETLEFNIEGYYTGYNNKNEEFQNPYKSNVVKDKIEFLIRKEPRENIFNFYVDYIDKHYKNDPYNKYVISIQDIIDAYNSDGNPANKKFVVRWQAERGNQGVVPSMIMSETKESENYGDEWDSDLIEDYIVNTGIYFTGADAMLGEDGSIKVFDNDTNELIKEFTKDEWNLYDATNPFKYENAIKHIRVETSTANMNSLLSVFNIKKVNVEEIMNKYTVEQIKELHATHTYLTGICNIEGVGSKDKKTADIAYFIQKKSNVSLSISKRTAIVYEKMYNQIITIKTQKNTNDDSEWVNGEFLVEVPEEILNMEINSITCNNPEVEIEAYELYQDENEKYFIKIITKNDEPQNYEIAIDCNLVPDPRVATVNRVFKLYAYNELTHDYLSRTSDIYDVNQNNNKIEQVGKDEAKIDILAPTSLLTMETITDYDETTDSEITIAPNVALVSREERQAKVNIHLTNNYTNSIRDIKILGKIPYKNNTYIINDKDLKSEFTTKMTENGINVSDEISDYYKERTTIYYSEKQEPTRDIEDAENGWMTKENVEDWSKIVSYLICMDNCVLGKGQEIKFNYDVVLPENVSLNMASYSTHAVYFNLNTEDGMIKLYTEPTKVGIRIVKKYELDLTKFKLNTSVVIPGVTYSLKYSEKNAEGETIEKQSIVTTDENGRIVIQGLFAGIEYTLKEIKTPVECELNSGEIKFSVDENDNITLTGDNKNYSYSDGKLYLDLENEIRAKIQISKTKKGTDLLINNVIFDVADEEGNHLTGKTINGFVEIPGLSLGKTYTLTEKVTPNAVEKNEGKFKFRLIKQGLTDVNIEVLENTLLKDEFIFENNINEICPVLKVNVEDEIRYNLNLDKKDSEGNAIKNIKFELSEENSTSKTVLTTNSEGKCIFNRLSLGKTYTLKEIIADGYYIDGENDYIIFKVERNGTLNITKFEKNGNIKVINEPVVTENGVNASLNITLENEKIPTYDLKIVKKNEFGATLNGAKFKLTRKFDGKEQIIKTDENGEIIFKGLFENIEGKNVTGEYELVETFSPEGYRLNDTILKFSATRDINGKLVFNEIEGGEIIKNLPDSDEKEITTDEEMVTISILNKPIFNLYKFGNSGELLPNAEFIITFLDDTPAKDVYGNYIGEYDNTYNKYVVKTDNEGKIAVNLPKGIYKAIEMEAPEGYTMATNIADRTFYFGIEESQDAVYSDSKGTLVWSKQSEDSNITSFNNVYNTSDNNYIVFADKGESGALIKYDLDGNIIWEKEESKLEICDFKIISNGVYEFIGKYKNSEYQYNGNAITTVQNKDNYVIVRIDNNGEYIEGKSFNAGENTKYRGEDESENILIQIDNDVYIYSRNGSLVGLKNFDLPAQATISKNENGYLVVIYTNSEINLSNDVTIPGGTYGAYAIFYDNNGDYKWYKKLDNISRIDGIHLTENNEFVIYGLCITPTHGALLDEYFYLIDDEGVKFKSFKIYAAKGHSKNRIEINSIKNITYSDDGEQIKSGIILTGLLNCYGYGYIGNTDNTIRSQNKDEHFMILLDSDLKMKWLTIENRISNDATKIGAKYFSVGNNKLNRYEGIELYPEIAPLQEINVYNEIKKYLITTKVMNASDYSNTGATITGEYNPYITQDGSNKLVEQVEYGKNSTRAIEIIPDEGYYIKKITINDVEEYFEPDETGKITIPSEYFKNVVKKQYIIAYVDKITFVINKFDENGQPISGAAFEVEQKLINKEIPDAIPIESSVAIPGSEVDHTELIGEMVKGDDNYYFEKNENGAYVPNCDDVTYCDAKGYIIVDLSDYEGDYNFSFDYTASSTISWYDLLNLYVNNSVEYDSTIDDKKVCYVYNNTGNFEKVLKGGKKYYLHFEFSKRSPNYNGFIDNIKLEKVEYKTIYMEKENDVYKSNNIGLNNSVAESYIPIDLTNEIEPYYITIDYTCKATNNDIGYIYITESTNAINLNNSNGRLVYCSSSKSDSISQKLDNGKKYYIHMGYKNGSGSNEIGDYFMVNNITLKNISGTPTKYTPNLTNEAGETYVTIKTPGTYVIREIEAPEGYILNNETQEITITSGGSYEPITFIDEEYAKVIVHHYLQGTGEEYNNEPIVLAENETIAGKRETSYTTAPNMEIEGYELIKDAEGEYILPNNATGTFKAQEQNVYYYYSPLPIELVVHHYLEGTEDKLADDEKSYYNEGEHYKTNPSEELLNSYILVNVVGDEEKDITENEEVTYYYVKKQHNITTKVETISYFGKEEKGGEITGEDETIYETVLHEKSNTKVIKMTPKQGYKIDKVIINKLQNGEIIESTEVEFEVELDGTYTLPTINNVEDDYEIVVRYIPDMGKVIVHHYIQGTETKIAPDETIIDDYGNVVKTNAINPSEYDLVENSENYILVESPANEDVTVEREDKEVTYYYQAQYKITTEVVAHNERINGEIVQIKGGSVSGEGETPYETVMKGNNSTKEIIATPDEGYKVKAISINGDEIDFSEYEQEDKRVIIPIGYFKDVVNDKHIVVEFERVDEGDEPGNTDNPENPENPDVPVVPDEPENPDTPVVPRDSDKSDETVMPENAENSEMPDKSNKPGKALNGNENVVKSPQTGDDVVVVAIVGFMAIMGFVLTYKKRN